LNITSQEKKQQFLTSCGRRAVSVADRLPPVFVAGRLCRKFGVAA
jgi:hypothetical protein